MLREYPLANAGARDRGDVSSVARQSASWPLGHPRADGVTGDFGSVIFASGPCSRRGRKREGAGAHRVPIAVARSQENQPNHQPSTATMTTAPTRIKRGFLGTCDPENPRSPADKRRPRARLSDAAGALGHRLPARRRRRHRGTDHRRVAFGTARPAGHHREPSGSRHQYRDRVRGALDHTIAMPDQVDKEIQDLGLDSHKVRSPP